MEDQMYRIPTGVWLLVDDGNKVIVKFEPQPKGYGLGTPWNVNLFTEEKDLDDYIKENNLIPLEEF